MDIKADIVIVGGGLAGCLTALKLKTLKPDSHIVVIDENDHLCGHQTWGFRESDLPAPGAMSWLKPVIDRSWNEYSSRFPQFEKTWPGSFHAIRSDSLDRVIRNLLGQDVVLGTKCTRLSESHVELSNGDIFSARLILDARGRKSGRTPQVAAYKKWIGQEFLLESAHGLSGPVLMDGVCPQLDGLRYFSVFPWDEKRVYIEEVYYSESAVLNTERIHRSLSSYVERRGWRIVKAEREEREIITIPLTDELITRPIGGQALTIGTGAGYFHSTSGDSLCDAVRIAEWLAELNDLSTSSARDRILKNRRPWLSQQAFFRAVNRFLFYAMEPSLRYQAFRQFFQQPNDLIERFFSAKLTWGDRMRLIQTCRLEVPLDRMLKSLSEKTVMAWASTRVLN